MDSSGLTVKTLVVPKHQTTVGRCSFGTSRTSASCHKSGCSHSRPSAPLARPPAVLVSGRASPLSVSVGIDRVRCASVGLGVGGVEEAVEFQCNLSGGHL